MKDLTAKFNALGASSHSAVQLSAVRRNPLTSRATDMEMDRAAMTWLRLTKDRNGGRELRAARKRAAENNRLVPAVVVDTVSAVAVDTV